jgi:tetratricopeptide (TPR) repeat protein
MIPFLEKATFKKILALFILLSFSIPSFSSSAFAQDNFTLEEIAKTDAAKYFVSKQYSQSLEEFKKLEKQHPENILIKRYIASLHDVMRNWDAAIAKLNEILTMKQDDLVARQMLGDIYTKQAELGKAEEQYRFIVNANPPPALGGYAQNRLQEIERIKQTPQTQSGKRMAAQDFMRSEPAQAFARGKFPEALQGFDKLIAEYPEDVLIRRFRGLSLLRLGKRDEAINTFKEALAIAPDNVATHFYLGQAYLESGKRDEARAEFQWVIAHDEGSYRYGAQRALFQSLSGGKPPTQKPWTFAVINGYDYDSNATYKSRDASLASGGPPNSGRYNTTLTGTYRLYQKSKWVVTADALYAQTLYNDFVNLQTFTPGVGLSALYIFSLFDRPAFFNLRDGYTYTVLRTRPFVYTNTVSPSLVFNPLADLRTTISYRFAYSAYHDDGLDKGLTSRDGFTNAISIGNTYYFNSKRNLYAALTYDFEKNSPVGSNYYKNAHGIKTDFHFPIVEKLEGELTFKFRDSNFPKYGYGPPARRDDLFGVSATLSRPLTQHITISGTYSYEDVHAENNLYEYVKHVFGVQLAIRY